MTSVAAQNQKARAYRFFSAVTGSLAPVFLLAIRLYWGWQFAETGWGKLHHLDKVTNFFTTLGIPAPGFNAMFVAALEFIGGIALALGFGSRLFAFLLAGDMFVAYLTAGRGNLLSIFSDPGKFYGDDAFTFLFASLIIMVFGPGKLALDEFLHRAGKF